MAEHLTGLQTSCELHTLPTTILQREVLTRLNPAELFRLAACCRQLLQAIASDDVWQPLCEQRGWGPCTPGQYMAGFARQQRVLCTECQRPTRYMFKLLGCRLCEACEHQSTRYALVTELEAQQRYGLSAAALKQLEYVESCGKQLYLREAVLKLAGPASGHSSASRQQLSSTGDAEGEGEGEGEGDDEEEEGEEEEEEEHDNHSDEDEQHAEGQSKQVPHNREEQRALRKAAKKQAKLYQRLRREAKAAGRAASAASYAMLSSSPPAGRHARGGGRGIGPESNQHHQQVPATDNRAGNSKHKQRTARLTKTSQQPPSRHAGLHQGLYPDEDTGSKLLGSSPKLKSAWLAEREQVMLEYGQFALSGLALA